jgi:hypothetical protein
LSEAGLISVRTEVVLDVLVGSLARAVDERMEAPLPAAVEAALAQAGDDAQVRAARAGWHARMVELERFERAREPDLLVTSMLSGVAACTELATREPLDRPQPDDERAMTWRVPGPGGHVRHYLAARAVGEGALELKRSWVYGFLLACAPQIEETSLRGVA